MSNEIQDTVDVYIKQLNANGLPYSATILERDEFNQKGIELYKDIPNVSHLVLLSSKEHPDTLSLPKFLVVEAYSFPTPEGFSFGVPSYSYVNEDTAQGHVSFYRLDEDTPPKTFEHMVDALSYAVKTFEINNFQKDMLLDVYAEFKKTLPNADMNSDLAQLSLASVVLENYNRFGKEIFETELNAGSNKLFVSCPKYNDWTEIVSSQGLYDLQHQVSSFATENFSRFVTEITDMARLDAKNELTAHHVSKLKHSGIKPR